MRALARGLLALYPLAYRRRYGEEMKALLEESGAGISTVLDLAKGAALAHLRPVPGLAAAVSPGERVRAGAVGLLASWLLVMIAGLGFYKTTENYGRAGRAHALLAGAHIAVQIAAVVGALAAAGVLLWLLARRSLHLRAGQVRLGWVVALAAVAAAAMTEIAAATAVYLVALLADEPVLGSEPNGPGGHLSVTASLAIQLGVMALAAALAVRAAWRGRQAVAN